MSTPADLAEHVTVIERYIAAEASGVFAGLYLDYRNERLCVGFTRDPERHLVALRERCRCPQLVVAFNATATRRELERLADRILEDLLRGRFQPSAPVADVRLDIPANRVVVTVVAPAPWPAIAAELAERYGGLVTLDATPMAVTEEDCHGRTRWSRRAAPATGGRRPRR